MALSRGKHNVHGLRQPLPAWPCRQPSAHSPLPPGQGHSHRPRPLEREITVLFIPSLQERGSKCKWGPKEGTAHPSSLGSLTSTHLLILRPGLGLTHCKEIKKKLLNQQGAPLLFGSAF